MDHISKINSGRVNKLLNHIYRDGMNSHVDISRNSNKKESFFNDYFIKDINLYTFFYFDISFEGI